MKYQLILLTIHAFFDAVDEENGSNYIHTEVRRDWWIEDRPEWFLTSDLDSPTWTIELQDYNTREMLGVKWSKMGERKPFYRVASQLLEAMRKADRYLVSVNCLPLGELPITTFAVRDEGDGRSVGGRMIGGFGFLPRGGE